MQSTDATLSQHCLRADSLLSRTVGLLRHKSLSEEDSLLIAPCFSIHTWFMRFSIDVVFLDRNLEVRRIVDSVPPFRTVTGWGAHSVLELPAGRARRAGLSVGDRLVFSDTEE